MFQVYGTQKEALESFGCTALPPDLPTEPTTALDLRVQQFDGVVILKAIGNLWGETSSALREAMQGLTSANKKILLDLSRVTRVDSTGVACLVGAERAARSAGAATKYVLSRQVLKALETAKLL